MRALTRGERNASVGVVAGLLGLICLLIASLGLNLKHASDLDNVKHSIYLRCLQRAQYDTASNDLRRAEVEQFWAFAAQEQRNPFINDGLRKQRVAAWTALAKAAQTAVDRQVRGGCNAYR